MELAINQRDDGKFTICAPYRDEHGILKWGTLTVVDDFMELMDELNYINGGKGYRELPPHFKSPEVSEEPEPRVRTIGGTNKGGSKF